MENEKLNENYFLTNLVRERQNPQPRSQGLSSYRLGGKMRDPGNEVAESKGYFPPGATFEPALLLM